MEAELKPNESAEKRKLEVKDLCAGLTDGDMLRELNRRGRLKIADCSRVYYPEQAKTPGYMTFIEGMIAKSLGQFLHTEKLTHIEDHAAHMETDKAMVRQMSAVVVVPPKGKTDGN